MLNYPYARDSEKERAIVSGTVIMELHQLEKRATAFEKIASVILYLAHETQSVYPAGNVQM